MRIQKKYFLFCFSFLALFSCSPTQPKQETDKAEEQYFSWGNLHFGLNNVSFNQSINKDLGSYNFVITGILDSSDSFTPSQLEIKDNTNHLQIIKTDSIIFFKGDKAAGWINIVDLNFDNYKDIQILEDAGATGNSWHNTYLFNPQNKLFEYNQFLSELSAVKSDTIRKIITTYSRAGACEESVDHYIPDGNKFHLICSIHTEADSCNTEKGCVCFEITEEQQNGKWVVVGNRHLNRNLFKER